MKRKLLLFVTALVLTISAVSFVGCKSETKAPKNYYGVQPDEDTSAPKGAYITLFCAAVGVIFVISWGIKKLKK